MTSAYLGRHPRRVLMATNFMQGSHARRHRAGAAAMCAMIPMGVHDTMRSVNIDRGAPCRVSTRTAGRRKIGFFAQNSHSWTSQAPNDKP